MKIERSERLVYVFLAYAPRCTRIRSNSIDLSYVFPGVDVLAFGGDEILAGGGWDKEEGPS